MRTKTSSASAFSSPRAIFALLLIVAGCSIGFYSFAATPSSGTLSDTTPVVNYTAGPFLQSNARPVPVVEAGPTCGGPEAPCDSYELTVAIPPAYIAANPSASAKVTLAWTDSGSGRSDYDLYIYSGVVATTDADSPVASRGASSANPEVASIFPLTAGNNKYTIKVVPFTATGETVRVKVELLAGSGGPLGFPGFGGPDPTVAGNPRYQTSFPPKNTNAESGSGEMNIGFNPATGRFMLDNAGPVWRVTPAEVLNPANPECCAPLWEDRSSTVADAGVDPILWTDQKSGRTFVSNFTGGPNALYAYTDNDGDLYVPLGAAVPTGGADHQTIGSGPYPASLSALTTPVNKGQAVYYCSQAIVGPAFCQRSDDLGSSYGPGTLAYSGGDCGGLHGHLRVGPDGAAYLPVPDCKGKAGVAVSIDGGLTWKEFFIPNSLPQGAGSDSSIAIDANNNLYYFYIVSSPDATQGTMHVQVGQRVFTNGQLTAINWSKDTDLGATHGIVNSAFPEAIAGDNGRAAVGFLGTDFPGDFQSLEFPGYWYAYMSTTYDGGNTWVTVNTSPNDPVQGKGGIWQMGGSATNRNLLDFNEITIDSKGRPAFGYSDGCVGDCVGNPDNNSFVAHMRLARQSGGRTLFASQDGANDGPNAPIAAKAACLSGTRTPAASRLTWIAPDNGGSDILYYKVYRGTAPGNETFLADTGSASVPNARASYNDTTADPNVEHYYYKVQAVTAVGLGALSNEIDLVVIPPPPCVAPSGPFNDDLEPTPNAGWTMQTGDNQAGPASPTWQHVMDPNAHSATHSFSSDSTTVQRKDDRLIAPPQNVSATTRLIFWHRYQFEDGYDGGVIEVSTDFGATWVDVLAAGGSFVSGGYNGQIDPGFGNPLAGRAAWTGGNATAAMSKVEINLGAYAGINVMIRWRLGTDNFAAGAQPGVGWFVDDIEFTNLQGCPVQLNAVVSRKTHGSSAFEVPLPPVGDVGIEPRRGGPNNGTHQVVFKFGAPVTHSGASVTPQAGSTATVANTTTSGNEVIVDLQNVSNAQTLTLKLSGVSAGGAGGDINVPMAVLLGDVNADRSTNSGDAQATRNASGQTTDGSNFRADVNTDATVNSGDATIVRRESGNGL